MNHLLMTESEKKKVSLKIRPNKSDSSKLILVVGTKPRAEPKFSEHKKKNHLR
jgi:hypothetical protein